MKSILEDQINPKLSPFFLLFLKKKFMSLDFRFLLCFYTRCDFFNFLIWDMKDVKMLHEKGVSNINSHSFQSFNLSFQIFVIKRDNLFILTSNYRFFQIKKVWREQRNLCLRGIQLARKFSISRYLKKVLIYSDLILKV